ncbi:hypothetical protein FDP41_005289 [Naegleria fowleri]|uniref:Uncharacterized protein n=1 Tax=Naegleria fowleri TaxID=5763 RepID=A0A6A5BM64_NAEFO|nr:uncharacterized protein FDP41_005289 [Naegleria fowleri]KAF0975962.1 hypothetical protein FDP41_005289 [Naegleria fowleri]
MKPLFLYISLGLFAGFELLQITCHALLLAVAAIFREFAVSTDSHLLMTRSVMFLTLGTFLMALIALKLIVWLMGGRYMYQKYREFTKIKAMTNDSSCTQEETQSINHHGRRENLLTTEIATTTVTTTTTIEEPQSINDDEINIYNSNNSAFRFLWNFRKTSARFLNLFIFAVVTLSLTSLILCITLSFLFLMYYSSVDLVYFSCTTAILISLLSLPLNGVLFFHSCYNESFAPVDSIFSLRGSSSSSSSSLSSSSSHNHSQPNVETRTTSKKGNLHQEEQQAQAEQSKRAFLQRKNGALTSRLDPIEKESSNHNTIHTEEEEEIIHMRRPLLNSTNSNLLNNNNSIINNRKNSNKKGQSRNKNSSSKPIAIQQDDAHSNSHKIRSSLGGVIGEDLISEGGTSTTTNTAPGTSGSLLMGEKSQF